MPIDPLPYQSSQLGQLPESGDPKPQVNYFLRVIKGILESGANAGGAFISPTAPAVPASKPLWFDTTLNGGTIKFWNSVASAWLISHDAVGAGGGGGGSTLPLDVAPSSPSVWNDEFAGATLDAKWTQISTACATTAVVENGLCIIEPTAVSGVAGRGAFGFRQTSPTGSFSVTAKLTGNVVGSDTEIDIGVASTSNNKANLLGRYLNGQTRILGVDYSETVAWPAFDGYVPTQAGFALLFLWVRIVWNATTSTIEFWFSQDGIRFTLITTRTAQVQPSRIFMLIYSNSSGVDATQYAAYEYIRVVEF